jgi:molecular chaperone GrpE (heat shock protein)
MNAEESYNTADLSPEGDWRAKMVRDFSAWLYALTEDETLSLQAETERVSAEDERVPDLMSFYNELNTLKQGVLIQAKATQSLSEKTESVISRIGQELGGLTEQLAGTAQSLKAHLPEARYEGEEKVLSEFIKIRESLADTLAVFQSMRLPSGSWFQGHRTIKIIGELLESNKLLLYKADDALHRFQVVPVCQVGMKFDPLTMRAALVTEEGELPAGTVTKVIQQGYTRNNKILQFADVQVKK